MAGLTIIASWMLVPGMGIVGAGWAWLLAQTAGAAVVVASGIRDRSLSDLRPAADLAPRKALPCAS